MSVNSKELAREERIAEKAKRDISGVSRRQLSLTISRSFLSAFAEEKLEAGEALPSNAALAKLIGVSHITIRNALKLLEQDSILKQIHGKGTFLLRSFDNFDKSLKKRVMLQLPSLQRQYAEVIDAIGGALKQHGYTIELEGRKWGPDPSEPIPARGYEEFAGVICSPAIYSGNLIREIAFYGQLAGKGVPVVFIDRPISAEKIVSVGFDDVEGMARIFDEVWRRGYRDIYFVYSDIRTINVRNIERGHGFKRGASRHSYDTGGKFFSVSPNGEPDYSKILLRHFIENSPSEKIAFMASNEVAARKIRSELEQEGDFHKKDILVTGYDYLHGIDPLAPSKISSYRNRRILGEAAAKLLLEQIKIAGAGGKTGFFEPKFIEPELVEAGKSMPPAIFVQADEES